MNRQCKCTDCGYVFDYEDAGGVTENHWLDGEYMGSETFLVCPNCGGDFEDAADCCECGEVFTESELYSGWCEKCLRETINYDTFFEYCESNKDEHYLDIFVLSEFLGGMDLPKDITTEFHCLMVEYYKKEVSSAQFASSFVKKKSSFEFIDRCIRFIMDDDGEIGRENYADWLNKREEKK